MLLEEAIQHCEEKALCGNACGLEHKQLADWLRELIQLRYQNERLLIIVHRQKYKRCSDKAKWCYSMDCRMLNEASDSGTYFKESWFWKRASWYGKWKRKYLELAKRFKEGV